MSKAKATEAEKNKGGRPPKLQPDTKTIDLVKGLGRIQATTRECAAVLGVTEPTYLKFKADYPEVAEAYAEGSGTGLTSLRRKQFEIAEKKGNPTMLIWLGKQYLGQSDKHQHAGPNGGPIQTVDLSKMSADDLDRLEAIFGPLAGAAGDDDAADQGGEGQAGI